ncbi:MAG: DUF1800 domain-containing protein [Thermoleophilia bacterium]
MARPATRAPARASLPVYRGPFGRPHAERLLWRAGFGPRPGEAEALAKLGLDGAVRALLHPGREKLVGPRPRDAEGHPIAPKDAWGHDGLWWLDRMVRTSRPLVERMTLVWHDWFATSNDSINSSALMLRQNGLFRRHALGSFRELLLGITQDPAMLLWLSGANSEKGSPNENYARELMELFTLGAYRGYDEQDVREQARALTGFAADWEEGKGWVRFRYEASRHDKGVKTVFGKRGRYDWRDACELCLRNPYHPSFVVGKLWSAFVATEPDAATRAALERRYRRGGYRIAPVLDGILRHPDLHEGPRLVKPPLVYVAGMLRRLGRGIDTDAWAWISSLCGQMPFYPPNVAGWDDARWLDTSRFRGRWIAANEAIRPLALDPGEVAKQDPPTDPEVLVRRALDFWRQPLVTDATRGELVAFARRAMGDATEDWQPSYFAPLTENALRMLIAVSPDFQTS